MSSLSFTKDKSVQRVLTFLEKVDVSFQPRLSTKVDLLTYSTKISKLGNVFFANLDNKDVGIVAFYMNPESKKTFITIIGVLPKYQGRGIGKFLLDLVQDDSSKKGMHCIELEVDKVNTSAISFYDKNGFSVSASEPPSSTHSKAIDNRSFYMSKYLSIPKTK
jgi:ribosomal protein S18 acetylase RimI-like enzyme